jgi:hypothetical protein
VVDVATADPDVAEWPPPAANAPGGEADESERAEEADQDVEQNGLAARGGRIALDRYTDGIDGRRRCGLGQGACLGTLLAATQQHSPVLTAHHQARR